MRASYRHHDRLDAGDRQRHEPGRNSGLSRRSIAPPATWRAIITIVLVAALAMAGLAFDALTPAASAQDGPGDALAGCARGVVVEGRCLSIDQVATTCVDDTCIEFVSESFPVCPAGSTALDDGTCELRIDAAQRPETCPDGSRGTVNECYIVRASGPVDAVIAPDGCRRPGQFRDIDNNCRQLVANARGAYYCDDDSAQLDGAECSLVVPREPMPCSDQQARFDDACWLLAGLTSPASCDGHGVAGTVTLPSGRCRVPLAIPSGASACVEEATFIETSLWVALDAEQTQVIDRGPSVTGCVEAGVNIGIGVTTCFYPDLDGGRGTDENGDCEFFTAPIVLTCPDDYSFDDPSGLCGRYDDWSAEVGGPCDAGAERDFTHRCLRSVDFDQFECPDGFDKDYLPYGICARSLPARWALSCNDTSVLEPLGGIGHQCVALVGPQPDRCNGLGTVEDCYEIREPVAVACPAETGCVGLGDFSVPGDVDCDGRVSVIDALVLAQYAALIRSDSGQCPLGAPRLEAFTSDGDMNGDQAVNVIDALLVAQCVTGAAVDAACSDA